MQHKFKVGDWVYLRFELGQITDVEDGRPTRFSNGFGFTSGDDLIVRPLTLPTKSISEHFSRQWRRIQAIKNNSINTPGLLSYIADAWLRAVDAGADGRDGKVEALLNDIDHFICAVVDHFNREHDRAIDGINLYIQ